MSPIPTNYVALSEYLEQHVATEQGALDAYTRLLEGRPDDLVTYLIGVILRDEERHHELFLEIRNSLESKVQWSEITPRVPSPRLHPEDLEALLRATDKLLALELEDLKELKQLRKSWKKASGDFRLWALLVETAELDTQKHIKMLRYLRDVITESTN